MGRGRLRRARSRSNWAHGRAPVAGPGLAAASLRRLRPDDALEDAFILTRGRRPAVPGAQLRTLSALLGRLRASGLATACENSSASLSVSPRSSTTGSTRPSRRSSAAAVSAPRRTQVRDAMASCSTSGKTFAGTGQDQDVAGPIERSERSLS